jgi:hypothetical protein
MELAESGNERHGCKNSGGGQGINHLHIRFGVVVQQVASLSDPLPLLALDALFSWTCPIARFVTGQDQTEENLRLKTGGHKYQHQSERCVNFDKQLSSL